MVSSNGHLFRVTGPLCGEFTRHRWFPRTKRNDAEFWCFFFIYAWTNAWVNSRDADDLRRHRAYYVPICHKISLCITNATLHWHKHPKQWKARLHLRAVLCCLDRSRPIRIQWLMATGCTYDCAMWMEYTTFKEVACTFILVWQRIRKLRNLWGL